MECEIEILTDIMLDVEILHSIVYDNTDFESLMRHFVLFVLLPCYLFWSCLLETSIWNDENENNKNSAAVGNQLHAPKTLRG